MAKNSSASEHKQASILKQQNKRNSDPCCRAWTLELIHSKQKGGLYFWFNLY